MSSTEGKRHLELGAAFRRLGSTADTEPDFDRVYAAAREAEFLARNRRRRLARALPAVACAAALLVLGISLGTRLNRPQVSPRAKELATLSEFVESTLSPDQNPDPESDGLDRLVSDYLDQLWEEPAAGFEAQNL